MTELTCPTCHTALSVARDPSGAVWVCPDCAGAAASLAVLRKRLKPGLATDFWRKVLAGSVASQRPCPSCGHSMRGFGMPVDGHAINLDLCQGCQFVWFDGGELEALPKATRQDEETRRQEEDAVFNSRRQKDLSAGHDPEVEKVEQWAYTGWLAIDCLLDLFIHL